MDPKKYPKLLDKSSSSSTPLMCEYCGVETPSMGDICMCSNCEGIVTTSRNILERKDQALLEALDNINIAINDQKYDVAMPIYDNLIAERKIPSLMYAAAITYLKYSNYEITQIGYMKQGFMEDNTIHRDKAAKLVSSSKKLLTKSISMANAEIKKGNTSVNLIYNRFLAQVKMGSMRGAKDSIVMLKSSGNEYVYNYAIMVFESRMERFEEVMEIAETLTKNNSFSINAFYYIGLALFKKGKIKEAKLVLQSLNGIMKNSNLEALIFEIDCQLATLR
jgi:tetratricopeptide (TPR) repeat protein